MLHQDECLLGQKQALTGSLQNSCSKQVETPRKTCNCTWKGLQHGCFTSQKYSKGKNKNFKRKETFAMSIAVPMPMSMLKRKCKCQDFQIADNQQLRKPDKDAFVSTVAFRNIPKSAELQIDFGNL